MAVKDELKFWRETNHLSQKDISKSTGIPQQTLSSWETGIRTPNINYLITLADFYEITVDELIGHEVKKNF